MMWFNEDDSWLIIIILAVLGLMIIVVCFYCLCKGTEPSRINVSNSKLKSHYVYLPETDDEKECSVDLHRMTVGEARREALAFIREQRKYCDCSKFDIITGRGAHSSYGIPKIKNMIKKILYQQGLDYYEVNKGGRIRVNNLAF